MTRANGFGITNRSQLRSLHARSADAATGRMKESDLCAATNAPGANVSAGPRGPSGVIATSWPDFSSRTSEMSARSAPRVVDPRMSPYPSDSAARATISPSRCSLIRTSTPCPRWCQSSGSRWPCQRAKMNGRPPLRRSSRCQPFTTRMRQVRASIWRNPLPRRSIARDRHVNVSSSSGVIGTPRGHSQSWQRGQQPPANQASRALPPGRGALPVVVPSPFRGALRAHPPFSRARHHPE